MTTPLNATKHEIYARRRTRNIGLGAVLVGTVALIFAVTIVKLSSGVQFSGFDHTFETAPGKPLAETGQ